MPQAHGSDHAQHDRFLVAALAGGDLSGSQASAALALLRSCEACLALHDDLVAIAAATRSLPRAAMAPRDYRLLPEVADRLTRGSRLRAFLRTLASPGSVLRPVAAASTSLGLVGLLVAAFVPGLLGGSAASAPLFNAGAPGSVVTSGGQGPEGPAVAPAATRGADGKADSTDGGFGIAEGLGAGGEQDSARDDARGPNVVQGPFGMLAIGSAVLLGVGLTLFALRRLAAGLA